uniref:Uncharacterized protein n=1 Tax=Aegilops tauschii subsp. strangulata TaxID=200361 RepID=A0A453D3Y7_AEGTS
TSSASSSPSTTSPARCRRCWTPGAPCSRTSPPTSRTACARKKLAAASGIAPPCFAPRLPITCLLYCLPRIHKERVEKWEEEIRELRARDAANERTRAILHNAQLQLFHIRE